MATDETEPVSRASIDDAIRHDRAHEARRLLTKLWRAQPGPTLAGYLNARFARIAPTPHSTRVKVALLRSCTLEPVVPVLKAAAWTTGLELDVHVGEFNSYAQEILDPHSTLYAFEPDVAILAVDARDIAPDLTDGFADVSAPEMADVIERITAHFGDLLSAFRANSQAHLVVHNLAIGTHRAHGLLDGAVSPGQAEATRSVNAALVEAARQLRGIHVLDYDDLIARHGRARWQDDRKWMTMRVPLRSEHLAALADEWLRFLHPLSGRICKVLVLDLDNTLWGGVVGEDGPAGLAMGEDHPGGAFRAVQRAALDLHHRGILLAIASKNNPSDAMDVLENHPDMLLRPRHFAAMQIGWNDKASSIRTIANDLNLGLDAIAFLDDNPAERHLVGQLLPEVTVIDLPADPGLFADALRSCPQFERLTLATEDLERANYYAADALRSEQRRQTGSLEEYYRSLEMELTIDDVQAETVARSSQLTNKTNQFNLTTRRYSEQQIEAMTHDPTVTLLTARARDRFGDNGLVGLVIARRHDTKWEIDTFLLSCRVIGRTIETALLAELETLARASGGTRMIGQFIRTAKNGPVAGFFSTHGYRCTEDRPEGSTWELDLDAGATVAPPWIVVHPLHHAAQHHV